MPYQLVLQWPDDSPETFAAVIEVEDQLIDAELGGVEVDGHDVGGGSINLFMWTEDPHAAFSAVLELLGSETGWRDVRAGFREHGNDEYQPLWPDGLEAFDLI